MKLLILVEILQNISPRTGYLLSRQFSKTKSIKQLDLLAKRAVYSWKELPEQIEMSSK